MAPNPLETDLVCEVGDDAAYLALVDLVGYSKDLPNWNYTTLTRKLAADMSEGRVVAWGCPDGPVQVRLTRRPLDATQARRTHAAMTAVLQVSGPLCLVGYSSLTMCAQFEDTDFPQPGDVMLSLPPGRYRVDVHRQFAHQRGEQCAEGELPEGDAYVVVLTPSSNPPQEQFTDIPWALEP